MEEWSEKQNSETPEEDIEDVDLLMTGSRKCPEICVGPDICCLRSKVSRRVKNEVA